MQPPGAHSRGFRSSARSSCTAGGPPLPDGSPFMHGVLANNQFASGGLVLMAVGAAVALAKSLAEHLVEYAQRRLFVRADIDSRDDAYRWLMHWLSAHPSFSDSPRVSILTSLSAFGTKPLEGGLVGKKQVMFIPAPGDHLVAYKDRWIWVSRTRAAATAQAQSQKSMETLTLTVWGRSRGILEDLIADAARAYEETTRQRTVVHSVADGYWERVGSRPVRPISSIILPGRQAYDILADCREFLDSEAWYAHHGIPHRRGYLLYGAPGTGKTSLVTALAGELGIDVYVVTLSSPTMTDEMLRSLLNSAAVRSLLLLEDVDAAFVGREAKSGQGNLSFSGLLNAIDGVAAQEGRLLFMTTNHIDRLSKALIRPGRVDYRLEFKLADKDQIRRLFTFFYKDVPLPVAEGDAGAAPQGSPAAAGTPTPGPSSGSPKGPPVQALTTATSDAVPAGGSLAGQVTAALASPSGTSRPSAAEAPPGTGHHHHTHQQADRLAARAASAQAARLEHLAEEFCALVPEGTVSMAQLQGYLMQHKASPEAAVRGVPAWLAAHVGGGGGAPPDEVADGKT